MWKARSHQPDYQQAGVAGCNLAVLQGAIGARWSARAFRIQHLSTSSSRTQILKALFSNQNLACSEFPGRVILNILINTQLLVCLFSAFNIVNIFKITAKHLFLRLAVMAPVSSIHLSAAGCQALTKTGITVFPHISVINCYRKHYKDQEYNLDIILFYIHSQKKVCKLFKAFA